MSRAEQIEDLRSSLLEWREQRLAEGYPPDVIAFMAQRMGDAWMGQVRKAEAAIRAAAAVAAASKPSTPQQRYEALQKRLGDLQRMPPNQHPTGEPEATQAELAHLERELQVEQHVVQDAAP
jgi:hypothetical protein